MPKIGAMISMTTVIGARSRKDLPLGR